MKMKAIWLNDIHLEFLGNPEIESFVRSLADNKADGVLIAGDIAQAHTVSTYLSRLQHALAVPIYFVLGNHDFYHGSIAGVRSAITALVHRSSNLHWLSETGTALQVSPPRRPSVCEACGGPDPCAAIQGSLVV